MDVFRERIDFEVENTVPSSQPFAVKVQEMIDQKGAFFVLPEEREVNGRGGRVEIECAHFCLLWSLSVSSLQKISLFITQFLVCSSCEPYGAHFLKQNLHAFLT